MGARDELAHGRHLPSERTRIDVTLDVPDDADPYDVLKVHLRRQMFPLLDIDTLDTLAADIDSGLHLLWEAAGKPAHTFDQAGMTSWTAKAVGD
jgi:hypothetical protein